MKIQILIPVFILILFSCNRQGDQRRYYVHQEDTLLYQIVDSLINPDSVHKEPAALSPSVQRNGLPTGDFMGQPDSLPAFHETIQVYIAIYNRLIRFSMIPEYNYIRDNPEFYFKYVVKIRDRAYFDLFTQLLLSKKLRKRSIEVKGFQSYSGNEIIPVHRIAKIRPDSSQVAEMHQFSRVMFNDKFDKACFYDGVRYNMRSTINYLVFLEKKSGCWTIVKKQRL
ncbi:MAG: hypothetical protein JW973_02435 [Bacteroidales bacterium]|nr:hypothetical protein [Bacteroidales bacterium]